MEVHDFVAHLCALPGYQGQVVHLERLPPRPARHGELERPLPARLQQALTCVGAEHLYSHQAEAINALRRGRSVIVTTGTASGKSLCYQVPLLEAALVDPLSRALYLSPTKALAQDQLRALRALVTPELGDVRYGTYDGDTAQGARARIRRGTHIVLSNPDMLNVGILPHHPIWAAFFRHLRYVVLDEAHVYRGVFGSHVGCLLRRLRRVCALYGSRPQFILCSATVANPGEHAARLVGDEIDVVDEDGSPQGPRQFILWNPPYTDPARGQRRSINTEATDLLAELVRQGLRTITFVRARKVAELLLLYVRQALRREHPELMERVSAYRAGYLPEERRDIERRLFSGELLGVAATNALELGIDVGQLDATVLVGYPGTIASTWQQAGRAGRGQREALSILIGQDNPLDQYLMHHPQELFGRWPESALIAPDNPYILAAHLPCAALEDPLRPAEAALFGGDYQGVVAALEREQLLQRRGERWFLAGEGYPAQRVNIRGALGGRYLVLDEGNHCRPLEEVEEEMAFVRIHPGAIYLHRAESYLITRLDQQARIAYARRVEVTYYTQPHEINEVRIVRSTQMRQVPSTALYLGRVRVTQQVVGFRRKQQFSEEVLTDEPLDLPPYTFQTQALWFEVPADLQRQVEGAGLDFEGGLHAVEHACIAILPLFAMCDRDDLAGLSSAAHADTGHPQIFVYDAYPGGVGIAEKGFTVAEELWQRTLEAVRECRCEAGCPSCIQSPKCGNNNEPLDKRAAILLLEGLLRSGHSAPKGHAATMSR